MSGEVDDLDRALAVVWLSDTKGEFMRAREAVLVILAARVASAAAERGALVHEVLHKAWLAVHIERFSESQPDCIYNGIRLAETAIAQVASEYGIDWRALRAVLAAAHDEGSEQR